MLHGRLSRVSTIGPGRISLHFIPRSYLAILRIVGLVQNLDGGRQRYHGRLLYSYYGRRVYFALPVIIIAEHIINRSGQTRLHAPLVSRAKSIWAKILFRSLYKTSIAILCMLPWHF